MEIPHIKFTWSSEALASILDTLGVQGLSSNNKTTGLYSTWPDQKQWASYTAKLMQLMPNLLTDEERNIIEQKLSSVETAFNTYLSQPNASNNEQRITELRELLKQLEEIEALICDRGSYAAYPYFARWFTLNVAVVKALMNDEERIGQVQGVKVWWSGLKYLGRVFESAYTARKKQVTVSVTGPSRDHVYVRDEQTDTPLTIDVAIDTEDEAAIWNLRNYFSSEAGWKYIQDISLEGSFRILEQVRNSVVVTTDSPTKQDQVFDVNQLWHRKQESIENEIAELRKEYEPLLERLTYDEARQQSSPATQPQAKVSIAPQFSDVPMGQNSQERSAQPALPPANIQTLINTYQPWAVATAENPAEVVELEREFPSAIEIIGEVVPNLLSLIPVVGDVFGAILGPLFFFLGMGASKPNPWVEFEKKMERLIDRKIADHDATIIKRELGAFDRRAAKLLKDYHDAVRRGITNQEREEYKDSAKDLAEELHGYYAVLIRPAEGAIKF